MPQVAVDTRPKRPIDMEILVAEGAELNAHRRVPFDTQGTIQEIRSGLTPEQAAAVDAKNEEYYREYLDRAINCGLLTRDQARDIWQMPASERNGNISRLMISIPMAERNIAYVREALEEGTIDVALARKILSADLISQTTICNELDTATQLRKQGDLEGSRRMVLALQEKTRAGTQSIQPLRFDPNWPSGF